MERTAQRTQEEVDLIADFLSLERYLLKRRAHAHTAPVRCVTI
jgi:hypothetical protein